MKEKMEQVPVNIGVKPVDLRTEIRQPMHSLSVPDGDKASASQTLMLLFACVVGMAAVKEHNRRKYGR